MSELQDTITGKDTLSAELRNQVDDLQYELNKVRARNDKLEHHLGEAIEKLKAFQQIHGNDDKGTNKPNAIVTSSVSQTKVCPNLIVLFVSFIVIKHKQFKSHEIDLFNWSLMICKESWKKLGSSQIIDYKN